MKEIAIFEAHSSYVLNLLFTADGKTLISSGMDNVVNLWDVPTWSLVDTLTGRQQRQWRRSIT
jgi:WD40 repeat protein